MITVKTVKSYSILLHQLLWCHQKGGTSTTRRDINHTLRWEINQRRGINHKRGGKSTARREINQTAGKQPKMRRGINKQMSLLLVSP